MAHVQSVQKCRLDLQYLLSSSAKNLADLKQLITTKMFGDHIKALHKEILDVDCITKKVSLYLVPSTNIWFTTSIPTTNNITTAHFRATLWPTHNTPWLPRTIKNYSRWLVPTIQNTPLKTAETTRTIENTKNSSSTVHKYPFITYSSGGA